VQRAKVMSVGSLMRPANGARDYAGELKATQKIAAVAAKVVEANRPFAVTDASGALVGELAPQAVLDVLTGRGLPA
jgi:glycine betaine/proline transport system ATP-binding protein